MCACDIHHLKSKLWPLKLYQSHLKDVINENKTNSILPVAFVKKSAKISNTHNQMKKKKNIVMGICIFAILSMEYIKFTHIAKMLVDMIFFFLLVERVGSSEIIITNKNLL